LFTGHCLCFFRQSLAYYHCARVSEQSIMLLTAARFPLRSIPTPTTNTRVNAMDRRIVTPQTLSNRLPHNTSQSGNQFEIHLRYFIVWVHECSISISGRRWTNTFFSYSVLCSTISTHTFRSLTYLQACDFRTCFCSKSHLNCASFPKFKPSFPKIDVGHSTLQHSGEYLLRWWEIYEVNPLGRSKGQQREEGRKGGKLDERN
jgi:hypothetical protein